MQSVEQRDEVEMLSLMLLIRRFEERASQQYQAQKIGGFCHLYIGQEAVVAGARGGRRGRGHNITSFPRHPPPPSPRPGAKWGLGRALWEKNRRPARVGGADAFFFKAKTHV